MSPPPTAELPVEKVTVFDAEGEMQRLADAIAEADRKYHQDDAPELTDAEYDALRRRYEALA